MRFDEYYNETEYIFGDEIESEFAEDAYNMAKKHGISVLSDKELYCIAVINDEVIGALWTTWLSGEFSFDVVVRDDYQGEGIGNKLVDISIQEYGQTKEAYDNGDGTVLRVDVINPQMEKMLLKKGFKIESKQPGHTMMVKY